LRYKPNVRGEERNMKAKNLAADPGKASTSESNSDVRADQVTRTPTAEAIQLRAYEIYLERRVTYCSEHYIKGKVVS
jgi:hypothetical protein